MSSSTGKEMFDLSGKITLVTGGQRGLGRAMAEGVAECGSDVIINYPFEQEKGRAEETAALISALGVKTHLIRADVSKADDVEHMFREVESIFGRVDALINNAGITSAPAWIHEMAVADFDRVINVNLRGSFLCMKYALPLMMAKKQGCIINVSSVAALRAADSEFSSIANYSASKAAVLALTRQAAADYAPFGIRVNSIALGHIGKTELAADWRSTWSEDKVKEYRQKTAKATPMGRSGREDEIKGLIVFLVSDASSYMTGQTVINDGGLSIL
jgi:NAD(P)-dependent dehydrogenase (short-subunit alcohol dehydrogenase family)